ncbi:MAG TPA: IPExxxVDY family protein [Flavobacteriaceae bacterium]|nr:IPExxxVDY family protein [Flavobacteriaceae bacterium]
MAIHKLALDDFFEEEQFSLIAIHCGLQDFRVAYLLNKNLNLALKRTSSDLNFKNGASYSVFEWESEKEQNHWNLISNHFKKETVPENHTNTLFQNQSGTKTVWLIPELKKVNYFLKISSDTNALNEAKIVANIQKIPQIVTAYTIESNQLTSRGNLIF